jgi:ketosteroid isomerase-like protein
MIKLGANRKSPMLIAVLLGLCMGNAYAQSASDVADVSAANTAFYTAFSALDAAAMEKVWAHESYVTSIGPRSKVVLTGWVAVLDSSKNFMTALLKTVDVAHRSVIPVDTQTHINGTVAWIVGQESVSNRLKDGTEVTGTNFVTNIFEKRDGHWLMVSHHAQTLPQ